MSKSLEDQIWQVAERMQGEIAREIRALLDESPYPEKLFDEEQRNRRIDALKTCAAEDPDPLKRHESWMAQHAAAGWVLGEKFDPVAKTHPNLRPYDELPKDAQHKANIFAIVAKAASAIVTEVRVAQERVATATKCCKM